MKLSNIIEASATMLPSIKNIQSIKIIQSEVSTDTEVQGIKIKTDNEFIGHALYKTDKPDEAFAIELKYFSNIKGVKGRSKLTVFSDVLINLTPYEEIKKFETNEQMSKFLDLLHADLGHMQKRMLHYSELKVKTPSPAYDRLIMNQTYGSKLIIPALDEFKSNLIGLSELEIGVLEASARICLSSSDHLYHIFSNLYFSSMKHSNAA